MSGRGKSRHEKQEVGEGVRKWKQAAGRIWAQLVGSRAA